LVEPYGVCRLCTVEVVHRGRTRLVTSCNYPVRDGIVVKTQSERLLKGRRLLAELLLARCPNVNAVRLLAAQLGVEKSRFSARKDTCILCGQCVRVCQDIVGASAISFAGRGIDRQVMPAFDRYSDLCVACGVCTYICPTGHIQMESQTREHWRQTLPPQARECRFVRMGFYSHKICPNDFHCETCDVDQRLEDLLRQHPAIQVRPASRLEPKRVAEFELPTDLHYTRGHVWARFIGTTVRLGIDDFTRAVVHKTDRVRVPPAGSKVGAGGVVFGLTSGDKQLAMLSPLPCTILSVNPHLVVDPPLPSREPYGRGWIVLVRADSREAADECRERLMTGHIAEEWLGEETVKIYGWTHPIAKEGVTQDARLKKDIPAELNLMQWKALTNDFFGKY
jgi:glycine cleavage system H lipoate-binding protein/ferredoxin